jgi:O-antigen ligase
MAYAHPFFGVGLRNYEFTYDAFDFLNGIYGKGRSVHSSHFQVLAETGLIGSAFYVFLFTYGLTLCFRVRARSRRSELTPELQKFFYSASNAIIASMFGFLAGGSFIALALNDITWLTFALIASLDIIFRNLCQPSTRVVPAIAVKAYDLVPST